MQVKLNTCHFSTLTFTAPQTSLIYIPVPPAYLHTARPAGARTHISRALSAPGPSYLPGGPGASPGLRTCLRLASPRKGRGTDPNRPHPGALARGQQGSGCSSGVLFPLQQATGLSRLSPSPVGARQDQLRRNRERPTPPSRASLRLASRSTGEAGPISERRLPSDSRPPTRASHRSPPDADWLRVSSPPPIPSEEEGTKGPGPP
ncbi:PREDICTED: uncharacterized protein LOC106147776 [Chinchilla lanigera]|uniref:uncharacterized protein LOC106147776 n=1 Tax=Chinchilla lanigera TaxID=34839 RepID=UPI0006962374|nr:PREDICTED: uncharacterized protein LOC106147776 [Chinchilla lanigera]